MSKLKARSECIVFVYLPGEKNAVPAGRLTIHQSGRDITSTFVYGNLYRARPNAISLDPQELPLTSSESEVLHPKSGNVMFGCFQDAAPNAWGRLVINDRWVHRNRVGSRIQQANTFDLPEMEYLLRSRNDRVGALDFREKPTDPEPSRRVSGITHLKDLIKEASRISRNEEAKVEVMTLLHPGTGMGGARPKTSIEDEDGLWLAKFPLDSDDLPMTRIEHAMLLLAGQCGIATAPHKLQEIPGCDPVFMIERFDRRLARATDETGGEIKNKRYTRTAYLSALTAMGKDEFTQSDSSYQEIGNYLRRFSPGEQQSAARQELFRRMVFNVLIFNDDDHLRNHGFLRNADGTYSLAPIFDTVPRMVVDGMGTLRRQAIGVGREGRVGTLQNMLSDLEPFDLNEDEARQIACEVACAVSLNWRQTMRAAGIEEATVAAFENIMSMADQMLEEMGMQPEADCRARADRDRQR